MEEIPNLIKKKYKRCQEQLLLLEMTEETITDLRSQWQKKVELLSFPNNIKKMPAVVIEQLNNQDQIYLYLDLISQYIAFGLCHTRRNASKKNELLRN